MILSTCEGQLSRWLCFYENDKIFSISACSRVASNHHFSSAPVGVFSLIAWFQSFPNAQILGQETTLLEKPPHFFTVLGLENGPGVQICD